MTIPVRADRRTVARAEAAVEAYARQLATESYSFAPSGRSAGVGFVQLQQRVARLTADADMAALPAPQLDTPLQRSQALFAAAAGGVLELAALSMSQGRRAEVAAGEAHQRARATEVDAQLDAQREALERAEEASEDAGFWDSFGEIGAIVAAAAAVVAAIPTGGATLALAGIAAAAVIGAQHADDIAQAMCDAGIVSRNDLDTLTLGLSIGFAAAALATGIGGAVAGAGAAASSLTTAERVLRVSAQVVQVGSGLAQGVATGGRTVCAVEEADARVDAERAEHEADVAQESRDEMIESIQAAAQAWCREISRFTEMQRTVHQSTVVATHSARV